MPLRTLKDLANEMQLHPRTVKRWWKALGVPPDIAGHGCHRWSEARFRLLIDRWAAYWRARGKSASNISDLYSGKLAGFGQPEINFNVNTPYKILTQAKWEKERKGPPARHQGGHAKGPRKAGNGSSEAGHAGHKGRVRAERRA